MKVLDFGLAKALDTSTASAAADNSPTRTALTHPGFIVGTAAYMSPEQARGVWADHRTDVFSLGCVLYEMLTGTRAFHGETPRDVLASIVARDADLTRLPGDLHPDVRTLIKRCLEKSVRHRWQAIGDVRIEIERILAAHPTGLRVGDESAKAPAWWRAAAIIATIVAVAAVATLVTWKMRATRGDVAHPVRRFSIPLDLVRPVVSPDGQHIAYRWQDRLWIRDLNSDVSREIPGGEARGGYYNDTGYYLTWSPDSQSVAFLANNEIRRASVVGGGSSTMTISTLPASSTANKRVGGMAWSRDGGTIVFSRYGAGI